MKKFLMVIGLSVPALPASAQDAAVAVGPAGAAVLFSSPHFFAALLVGLALAVAFQLALTHLSVAAGISALGPVDKKEPGSSRKEEKQKSEESGTEPMKRVRKITAGYGIWSLITASIALFFASWMAVKISLSPSALIGAILGLTIWGLFYIAATFLQVGAVTSLVGSLIHAAASGFRSVGEAASSLFTRSPEEKAADTAAKVTASIRDEIFGKMSPDEVREQMQHFIQELKPKPIDARQIREEISQLFDETEIKAISTHNDKYDYDRLVASFETKYGNPERREKLKGAAKEAVSAVKEEAQSEKPVAEKVADAGLRLAGFSKEEAEKTRREWEEYLRRTGKEELNPDNIKREIEVLIHDPKQGAKLLQSRASEAFNKSTVVSLLAQREDMSREEAERTADRAEQIIREFRERGSKMLGGNEGAVARVREYLNAYKRPEKKYGGIGSELIRLFQDPKGGAEALVERFKSLDRESLKEMVANRTDMSEEDVEHILNQIESTRDKVTGKAEEVKAEVARRTNQMKEEALKQAEETRKVAASAAWWSFTSAVVSGVAAVVGGMVGIR